MKKKRVIYFIVNKEGKVKYVGNCQANWLNHRMASHINGGAFYNPKVDDVIYIEFEDLEDDELLDMALHIAESIGLEYDFMDMDYDTAIVDRLPKKLEFKLWEGDK